MKWLVYIGASLFWAGTLIAWPILRDWQLISLSAFLITALLFIVFLTWGAWKRHSVVGGFETTWGRRVYLVVVSPIMALIFVTFTWDFFGPMHKPTLTKGCD
ncbi:MAG: hypothetical protein COT89_00080 [Candidatus Colwellbacteria bacterium CG10_big_fil_rev_8_21_14_0_10_42_22]|uniref:Uncharacterized protein n=1 Tax=Candidatus Colwellbacteria bacterium CG10_big_fil_rev_8_21_14_0_10_42_22 TaxID=1974540 RepID=A0A2H0VGP4_9BACT|nr:MAG: hypothetical protein COT89_00080 [Candidatus Colwellbacteria bacterium CG10_big_fil_rev_8_21_14_0_10_42_22]